MKEDDRSPSRQAILDILASRRGVHKSELCRATHRGWGTVGHHVYVLVRAGKVETEVHGRFLWVFLPEVSRRERDWLVATRVPERLRLLEILGLRKTTTLGALSHEMALSKKVIRTHLTHLRRVGAVERRGGAEGVAHEYAASPPKDEGRPRR